jgi:DNA-binding CsgD family transcriptional regulator
VERIARSDGSQHSALRFHLLHDGRGAILRGTTYPIERSDLPSLSVPRADFDALLRVVGSLAEFRDLDALRHHTVEIVPSLVPTNGVAWNEVDTERGRVEAVMEPYLVSEELAEAFVAYMGDHPVIANHTSTGDGRPYAISDFLNTRAFHATGIYRHFYRQLDAEDQISFILPDPRFTIGIALNRERRGFSVRERQILNTLRPHLVQAYRNAEDFSRLQRSLAGMEALVEQGGEGLILLDRRGSPEHWTPRAQDTFSRCFSGWSPGRLPEPVLAWLGDRLQFAAPPAPLLIDRGDRHLMVRRVPVPDGEVLLVSEVHNDRTMTLLHSLGLTRREAEILLLLTDGHTIAIAASRLGISPRTVEKHIQHGYNKLGLDNRVAATNLVRQLERGTS